jgi:hypothetical protein
MKQRPFLREYGSLPEIAGFAQIHHCIPTPPGIIEHVHEQNVSDVWDRKGQATAVILTSFQKRLVALKM